eukprot:CAMPEP_0168609238 /NCGR_PEP_ID=MMETSP0449_2-20121227/1090_1 /TAXON_ID=1082188 /ORGANISM="Strombidium rassoulzadegani, Strain ras09" /LENGTH=332 /DNA_ID=CAMNT_0008649349 /DNA_START=109 /DNA_END=1103 /DNA_ORIENTATION=-
MTEKIRIVELLAAHYYPRKGRVDRLGARAQPRSLRGYLLISEEQVPKLGGGVRGEHRAGGGRGDRPAGLQVRAKEQHSAGDQDSQAGAPLRKPPAAGAAQEQYLNEISLMKQAWIENPKLCTDMQKRQFLTDAVDKAKVIGVHDTVECLLPCLVNAFNCDEVIHQDVYDSYAQLLFNNMGDIITFLGKEERQKSALNASSSVETAKSGDGESDLSSDGGYMLSEGRESARMSGYQGITEVLFDQIFVSFFDSQRYDFTLKSELQDRAIEQVVQMAKVMKHEDRQARVVNLILDCISDMQDDDRRLTGVILLDNLAGVLGEDLCRDYLLYEFV